MTIRYVVPPNVMDLSISFPFPLTQPVALHFLSATFHISKYMFPMQRRMLLDFGCDCTIRSEVMVCYEGTPKIIKETYFAQTGSSGHVSDEILIIGLTPTPYLYSIGLFWRRDFLSSNKSVISGQQRTVSEIELNVKYFKNWKSNTKIHKLYSTLYFIEVNKQCDVGSAHQFQINACSFKVRCLAHQQGRKSRNE